MEKKTLTGKAVTENLSRKGCHGQEKKNREIEVDVKEYCICPQPETPQMIECSFCDQWYHLSCANLKNEDYFKKTKNTKRKWKCPNCEIPNSSLTKQKLSRCFPPSVSKL